MDFSVTSQYISLVNLVSHAKYYDNNGQVCDTNLYHPRFIVNDIKPGMIWILVWGHGIYPCLGSYQTESTMARIAKYVIYIYIYLIYIIYKNCITP